MVKIEIDFKCPGIDQNLRAIPQLSRSLSGLSGDRNILHIGTLQPSWTLWARAETVKHSGEYKHDCCCEAAYENKIGGYGFEGINITLPRFGCSCQSLQFNIGYR